MIDFEDIGRVIGAEVDQKSCAYGNGGASKDSVESIGEQLESFYPNGIPVKAYREAALLVRILDKMNRIAYGNKAAFGESPWKDIVGYAIRGYAMDLNELEMKARLKTWKEKIYRQAKKCLRMKAES